MRGSVPNQALQQTVAAMLASRSFLSLSAAAAAELGRSAAKTEVPMGDPLEGAKYIRIEASEVLRKPGFRPTREQFLADPPQLAFSEGLEPEWVVEAFRTNEQFRENILYALCRGISKGGDFSLASGWMEMLATGFSPAEVVSLYTTIRDRARRGVAEWRAEFEGTFPGSASYLPEVPREERTQAFYLPLFRAIGSRYLTAVQAVVADMRKHGIHPEEVHGPVFAPPPGVDIDEVRAGEYQIDLNAVEYAELVGAGQVLSYLRSCSDGAGG
jgi:hypothetical protein